MVYIVSFLMTPNLCPKCGRLGRLLEACSNHLVSYYRCDPCHHLWVFDNARPDLPPRDVMRPPRDRDDVPPSR